MAAEYAVSGGGALILGFSVFLRILTVEKVVAFQQTILTENCRTLSIIYHHISLYYLQYLLEA